MGVGGLVLVRIQPILEQNGEAVANEEAAYDKQSSNKHARTVARMRKYSTPQHMRSKTTA